MATSDGRAQSTQRGQASTARKHADMVASLPAPGEEWEMNDLDDETWSQMRHRVKRFKRSGVVELVEERREANLWRTNPDSYRIACEHIEGRETLPCGCRIALGNRGDRFVCLDCGRDYRPAVARAHIGRF